MKLTPKQQIFCDEYLKSLNATEAAVKAGYSPKTAYSIGAENLKKPDILNYIQERANKAHSERIATANEVLEYLSETMREESESRRERTKAAELLGKRYGLFIEKEEITGDGSVSVQIMLKDCKGPENE